MAATEYTPGQLRGMDDDEARQTLTVDQYERREQLIDLYEQAEETEAEWEAEAEQVAELTLRTDPEKLGTEVDLFGNDVIVYANDEDPKLQSATERLESDFGDDDPEDVPDFDAERADELADTLTTLLDCIVVRWNDTAWDDVPKAQRTQLLADARERWGVSGLMLAWLDIAEAIHEDREDKVSTIESFQREEGRGHR